MERATSAKFNARIFLVVRKNISKRFFIKPYLDDPTSSGVITLKSGRREVPGSIPGCACQPSRSEFAVVILRNSRKYGLGSFRKTPTEGTPPIDPGPTCGTIGLQPTANNQRINLGLTPNILIFLYLQYVFGNILAPKNEPGSYIFCTFVCPCV